MVIAHGARAVPAWAIRWQATCPAMPSAKEQIADHLANARVRTLIARSRASQAAQRVRGVGLDADFAERTWCKHCADLGFHVENMCVTSAVSL